MPRKPTPKIDRLTARVIKKRAETPRVAALLIEVLEATKRHGAKAELARELKVTPQRLNQWLAGLYEPGGEITLHLLEWVTAEGVKKDAEAVAPAPALKAQAKQSRSNEKQRPGQRGN